MLLSTLRNKLQSVTLAEVDDDVTLVKEIKAAIRVYLGYLYQMKLDNEIWYVSRLTIQTTALPWGDRKADLRLEVK